MMVKELTEFLSSVTWLCLVVPIGLALVGFSAVCIAIFRATLRNPDLLGKFLNRIQNVKVGDMIEVGTRETDQRILQSVPSSIARTLPPLPTAFSRLQSSQAFMCYDWNLEIRNIQNAITNHQITNAYLLQCEILMRSIQLLQYGHPVWLVLDDLRMQCITDDTFRYLPEYVQHIENIYNQFSPINDQCNHFDEVNQLADELLATILSILDRLPNQTLN